MDEVERDDPMLVDTPLQIVETPIIKVETPDVHIDLSSLTDSTSPKCIMGGAPEHMTQSILRTIPRVLNVEKTQSISENKNNMVGKSPELSETRIEKIHNNTNPKEDGTKKTKHFSVAEDLCSTVTEQNITVDNVTSRSTVSSEDNESSRNVKDLDNNNGNKIQEFEISSNSSNDDDNNGTAAVVNKPAKAAVVRKDYVLPEIKFKGLAHDLEPTVKVTLGTLVKDAYAVGEFLLDFECEVSGLDMEKCWYDLLEMCFKKTRTHSMKLYLRFTKRLYEGLTWNQAKEIIERTFGFECPSIKQRIQQAFNNFQQRPDESYAACFERFRPLAQACRSGDVVNHDTALLRKIIGCACDKIQQEYFANLLIEHFTKEVTTGDKWKEAAERFARTNKYYLLNETLKEDKKRNLSWTEFDEWIRVDLNQVTGRLEEEDREEKAQAEAAEEKRLKMEMQKSVRKLILKQKRQEQKAKRLRIKSLKDQGICTFCKERILFMLLPIVESVKQGSDILITNNKHPLNGSKFLTFSIIITFLFITQIFLKPLLLIHKLKSSTK